MKSNKNKTVEKDGETVKFAHIRSQKSDALTGRANLNNINKRNTEEKKQDMKSSYKIVGIMALLTSFILVLVYFFS